MSSENNYFDNFVNKQLIISKKIFRPNLTSRLSYEVAKANIKKKTKVLDLGCGCGVIGIMLKKKKPGIKIYFSDNHKLAIKITKKNIAKHKLKATIECGDLFKAWKNETFDYIIDDVSAISNEIAKQSPWFNNKIPVSSGIDGTKLTIKILKQAKKHLNYKGVLQIPLLSLSNTKKIIKKAKENFSFVKVVKSENWFLPDEMASIIQLLKILKKKKLIHFEEKFGKVICNTSILLCKN